MHRGTHGIFMAGVVLTVIGTVSGCGVGVKQTTNGVAIDNLASPAPISQPPSNRTSSKPTKAKLSGLTPIRYNNYQKLALLKGASAVGAKTLYAPQEGYGVQFEYLQRIKVMGGGYLLAINYTKVDIDVTSKPPLTNWTVEKSVKIPLASLRANGPVAAQWLTPPPSHADKTPVLLFKIDGLYYTIWSSLNETKVERMVESFAQVKA